VKKFMMVLAVLIGIGLAVGWVMRNRSGELTEEEL